VNTRPHLAADMCAMCKLRVSGAWIQTGAVDLAVFTPVALPLVAGPHSRRGGKWMSTMQIMTAGTQRRCLATNDASSVHIRYMFSQYVGMAPSLPALSLLRWWLKVKQKRLGGDAGLAASLQQSFATRKRHQPQSTGW
jgi:hypothetical protein